MYIEKENQLDDEQLSQFLNQLHFHINAFGKHKSENHSVKSYTSEDFEIIYNIEGKTKVTVGKKQYECPENSILILEPYGLNTVINEDDIHTCFYLHFEIEPYHLHNQFLEMLTKNGNLIYVNEFRDFKEMFERLLLEVRAKELGYTSIITSGLIRVLVEIIRAQYKRNPTDFPITFIDSQYVSVVSEALEYIRNHIQDAIKLEVMAKDLGVSTSYLYKAFHKVCGISPTKYIQNYKLSRAMKLFAQKERVNTVAQTLGYSSAYHLSKVFKEATGMSPREYCKKNNGN